MNLHFLFNETLNSLVTKNVESNLAAFDIHFLGKSCGMTSLGRSQRISFIHDFLKKDGEAMWKPPKK